MKFGRVTLGESEGSILAHAVRAPGINLKKGRVVAQDDIAALRAAGIDTIICASVEPGDVCEDEAASRLAARLCGPYTRFDLPFTGRCNIVAAAKGLLCIDKAAIDDINAEDEAVTVATIDPMQEVESGDIIAAVKVIPFAVASECLERTLDAVCAPAISIAPYRPLRISVISTLLPGLKRSTIDKTLRLLEDRLAPAGAIIAEDRRVMHHAQALALALRSPRDVDLIVIFGATAITDRRDIVPVGINMAGGTVDHLGMPVDPGNLLLLGGIRADAESSITPIIGAPGCARSAQESSFDLVLRRYLAGLNVSGADIRLMGVGGMKKAVGANREARRPLELILE